MERRVVDARLEVRAEDGEGSEERTEIVGYAAVFDSLSQVLWGFREKIEPGAFAESLGDDVRALWNHESAYVLGRTTAGTLRLAEDATGLRVEIDPPATALAESFVESIRRGDVNQMSFGFRVLEDEWDEDEDGQLIRTLRKVKLYEVSPVTFPAYPATEVGLRALLGDEVRPPERPATNERPVSSEQPVTIESDGRAPVEIESQVAALQAQAEARARRVRLASVQ